MAGLEDPAHDFSFKTPRHILHGLGPPNAHFTPMNAWLRPPIHRIRGGVRGASVAAVGPMRCGSRTRSQEGCRAVTGQVPDQLLREPSRVRQSLAQASESR